jgi:transcription elongation factor GreA-like protein
MLIAIDIVNIEKIFINFRIRTLTIDIIPGFSANIRAIRRNIKIIKIVVNFRKEEIISSNIIKEISIWIRKKLNDNRDFLFLSEYPNVICYIVDSNFVILRNINSEPHSRPLIVKEYDILITHNINIYRNTRP